MSEQSAMLSWSMILHLNSDLFLIHFSHLYVPSPCSTTFLLHSFPSEAMSPQALYRALSLLVTRIYYSLRAKIHVKIIANTKIILLQLIAMLKSWNH